MAHFRLAPPRVAAHRRLRHFLIAAGLAVLPSPGLAGEVVLDPVWPGDLSTPGLLAAWASDPDAVRPHASRALLRAIDELARLRAGTRWPSRRGSRPGTRPLSVPGLANVRVDDPRQDDIGETQAEVSIAVSGDTVVVGWNDCAGLLPGNTMTSFGYSTDGGISFTDGGNVPLALGTDFTWGETGIDTDERGNWYLCCIYQRERGAPGPTAEQDVAVYHGRFDEAGRLMWDLPVMASIGSASIGRLDRGLIACDRLTRNVYVAYTRLRSTSTIEIVRSTTAGASWEAPIVLDSDGIGTAMGPSKQAARPVCGPNGEVYVVWSKGGSRLDCPDPGPEEVFELKGQVGFSRSLDFGQTFSPKRSIGTVEMTWTWSGPGDVRERGHDYPDIAVDRSSGPHRGSIYVTWNESAPWSARLDRGIPRGEVDDFANTDPNTPDPFAIGDDVTAAILDPYDEDYWRFHAEQGKSFLFNIDPRGFVCGISNASAAVGMEIWAMQDTFPNQFGDVPDTLLAASTLGLSADRIVWTAPRTGDFLLDVYGTFGLLPLDYRLKARPLKFGAPSPARDARDVVLVRSGDGGDTWSAERLVNDDPPGVENGRPSVAVDGLGHAHVFWYDHRDPGPGTNAALVTVYGATSRDGGQTWTPNYQVADEPSFFSFNTSCAPNMGDYNQAAGAATRAFPGWSDQRLSSGDLRNPLPPPAYLAGLGPEVYTQEVRFAFACACPGVDSARAGDTVEQRFCVTNLGTIADSYRYRAVDARGWLEQPVEGTVGPVAPGDRVCIAARIAVADCALGPDSVTFTAAPVGEPANVSTCRGTVVCQEIVPALVGGFGARSTGEGVELTWTSFAAGIVRAWKVYRSELPEGGYSLVTGEPIPMGSGGEFRVVDHPAGTAGPLYYRLGALLERGDEVVVGTVPVTPGSSPASFSFAFSGPNPFAEATSFTYALPERAPVRIEVFSAMGQRLVTLADGIHEAGTYIVPFAPRDWTASRSPGVYQIRIQAGRHSRSLQAIFVR